MTSFLSRFARVSLAAACGVGLAALTTGCGSGILLSDNTTPGVVGGLSGVVHGGPNPIGGATITLYATGTTGYGSAATQLSTTTADANGNFTLPAGSACPAGQYGYITSQGGNPGGSSANGNILLMVALGPCSTVTSSRVVLINELTTVVAAYTLANFTSITGTAPFYSGGTLNSSKFTVNIGAPTSNSAATGCDVTSQYPTVCATTASPGLGHAFNNAAMLIDTSDAYLPPTTGGGATVPTGFLFALANSLQACVNSSGGGYNIGSAGTNGDGTPTTTTGAGGTTDDGTPCGKLFAFTSYTNTGGVPGTTTTNGDGTTVTAALVNAFASGTNGQVAGAPTNTLQAVLNLAKRPNGSASTFNSTCDSGSTGSTTAATCIFNLAAATPFYGPAITSAPNDWMFGIQYGKNAFANTTYTGTTPSCTSGTSPNVVNFVPATNGVLYPYDVKTDVDDNITLLNLDSSNDTCFNLITAKYDGTPISAGQFDTTAGKPTQIANDAYGHTIVPEPSGNVTNVYSTGTGTITMSPLASIVPLNFGGTTGQTLGTSRSNATSAATTGTFVTVANNSTFILGATTATGSNLGYCVPNSGFNHATVAYTCNEPSSAGGGTTFYTGKGTQQTIDISNNVLFVGSSMSSIKYTVIPSGYTAYVTAGSSVSGGGGTSAGTTIAADNTITGGTGHVFSYNGNGGTATQDFVTVTPYTTTPSTTIATATIQYTGPTTNVDSKLTNGEEDGNLVMFSGNNAGSGAGAAGAVVGSLRFYDTVNNYLSPQLMGCKIGNVNTTTCGQPTTDSSQSFLFYQARNFAIDSTGSLWAVNGSAATMTEVFGLAAPTLPMYIHNGTSNKP